MIGVVALMGAGLGTFASPGTDAVNASYETTGSPARTGGQALAADGGVVVSRGFDRAKLKQQSAVQAAQRTKALQQVDRDIAATDEVRKREKREKREKKVRAEKLRAERVEKQRNQWVLPVTGYRITARFGQQSSLWSSGAHTGLDFAGPSGSEIVSVAAGTVTSVGYEGSYGNRTVITLADGTMISYSHQSSFVVKAGEQVLPGQPIGYTGSTGNVTGPHLHLEIERPGAGLVDPGPVLGQHGVNP